MEFLMKAVLYTVLLHSHCGAEYCDRQDVDPGVILDKSLSHLDTEINNLKAEVENSKSEITGLQSTVSKQDEAIASQAQRIAKLEAKHVKVIAFTARLEADGYWAPTAINVPLGFTDVFLNHGGGYNSKTAVFTCPVSGIYMFTLSIFGLDLRSGTYYRSQAVLVHKSKALNREGELARVMSGNAHSTNGVDMQAATSVVTDCSEGDTVWVATKYVEGNQLYSHERMPFTTWSGVLLHML